MAITNCDGLSLEQLYKGATGKNGRQPSMHSVVVKLTPQLARELWEKNTSTFGSLDRHTVNRYASEMTRGRWQDNGESIVVSVDGYILDGQHRIAAVIQSGCTITVVLVLNVVASASTFDRGKPRQVSDYIQNALGIKNARLVATIAKFCVAYKKGLWGQRSIQGREILDSEILDVVHRYHVRIESVAELARQCDRVAPGPITATLLFFGGLEPITKCEISAWFVDSLATGANLTDADAVLHLRNRFLAEKPQAKIDPNLKRVLMTIAWNKTVRGEVCTSQHLRVRLSGPGKHILPATIDKVDDSNNGQT